MVPHGPVFESDDDATRSYIACGKVTVNWGPVELAIKSLLILLRNRQKVPRETPFPISLSKKLDEVKARLKPEPSLQTLSAKIGRLMTHAKILHKSRVIVVHGSCQGTDLKGDLVFGVSEPNRGISYVPKTISHADLDCYATEMTELSDALLAVFRQARMNL